MERVGSTASVSNVLSDLRCYFRTERSTWLDEADRHQLKRLIDLMKLEDEHETKQSGAITREILLRLAAKIDLSSLDERIRFTISFLSHDGLLRGGEVFSGIEVRDIEWSADRRSIIITLQRTKTSLTKPVKIEIAEHDSSDSTHGICGVSLLRDLFDQLDLWDHPSLQVFPRTTMSKGSKPHLLSVDFKRTYSRTRWIYKLRKNLSKIGLDPSRYSGHGHRAGGCTDLWDAGVSLPVICRYGRWKQASSALRYYREGSKIARDMAKAFTRNENKRAHKHK